MVGQCVEDFGTGEDMEADEKNVVGEQHESSPLIGKAVLSKDMVYKITDILDLWVFHNVFVHSDGSDPEEYTSDHHCNDAWNPSEHAEEKQV